MADAPRTIGPYRIDAFIGRGGMGDVYRGFDARLNRPVAIKVLPEHTAVSPRSVDRFLREARSASALNHPNIVTIHEVGTTSDGGHFIVQEFVAGRTLRALVEQGLQLETTIDIARQVARALATAHAAGIVHRDIKPENIMVRDDGYVKVLDFGLARITGTETGDQPTVTDLETAPGTILGTAAYMSPEQAQGRQVDQASDVFSLGTVLYEMATGRRPFTGSSSFGVLASIMTQHPIPPARLKLTLPPGLDALVMRMLAKAKSHRPTALDVEAALAALAGAPGAAEQPPAAVLAKRTTVGRERERSELREVFARVASGRGAFVTVTGEPGIGKTALLEDFLAELEVNSHRPVLARGRCSERLAGSEAYLPVLEALENLLHQKSGESFAELMKAFAPTWYFHVATLSAGGSSVEQLSADVRSASQERIKRELAALVQEISHARPLVVFFDDLHWADVSTIDLLNYAAARFDTMRVLVLGTYRPSEMALTQHPFLQIRTELQSRGVLEEIALEFLERQDIERYLAIEFPEHRFPEDLAELVHARTEGNPLFMADLLRYLKDRRAFAQDGGRWMLARPLGAIERELPESVRSMIQRKIERLDEADRRLLVAASVQGHEFDSTTAAAAIEMDPAEAEERLERLDRLHFFVKPAGEHEFADRTLTMRYRFVHVLYQNMLYGALQPTRRAALSGRVAAAIVRHQGDQSPAGAAQLAILFEAARDFGRAAALYLAAADHSATLFAFREAVALSRRGLKALQALPESPARVQQELGLQLILGLSLRSIQGWAAPEVEQVYTRARQLCAELGDSLELFPVLWGLTLYHAIRGDLRIFQPLAEQLLAQANETRKRPDFVAAHQMMASVNEFLGNTVVSSEHFERAVELYEPAQHLSFISRFGLDPGMISLALSVRPLWFLGYPDRSLKRIQETVALARSLKHPISIVFAVCLAENIRLLRGEAREAVALGDEMIAICREYGLAQEVEWGRSFQGLALADLGRAAEGVEQLRDSLSVQARISAGLLKPTFLAHLAEALWKADRPDEGLRVIDEAFEASEQGLERYYVAELHRLRAELLRSKGDAVGAEQSFQAALAFARQQGAKSLELRAATGLARLMHADGRSALARDLLAGVHGWFTEGHDTRDLTEAAALLKDL